MGEIGVRMNGGNSFVCILLVYNVCHLYVGADKGKFWGKALTGGGGNALSSPLGGAPEDQKVPVLSYIPRIVLVELPEMTQATQNMPLHLTGFLCISSNLLSWSSLTDEKLVK